MEKNKNNTTYLHENWSIHTQGRIHWMIAQRTLVSCVRDLWCQKAIHHSKKLSSLDSELQRWNFTGAPIWTFPEYNGSDDNSKRINLFGLLWSLSSLLRVKENNVFRERITKFTRKKRNHFLQHAMCLLHTSLQSYEEMGQSKTQYKLFTFRNSYQSKSYWNIEQIYKFSVQRRSLFPILEVFFFEFMCSHIRFKIETQFHNFTTHPCDT